MSHTKSLHPGYFAGQKYGCPRESLINGMSVRCFIYTHPLVYYALTFWQCNNCKYAKKLSILNKTCDIQKIDVKMNAILLFCIFIHGRVTQY